MRPRWRVAASQPTPLDPTARWGAIARSGQFFLFSQMEIDVEKPTIVCLCGSTRFKDAFVKLAREEALAGKIVLTVGLFEEGLDMTDPVKQRLDELHLRKIDIADEVLILNIGGHIGESTKRELLYATQRGKKIRYLEPPVYGFRSAHHPKPTLSSK